MSNVGTTLNGLCHAIKAAVLADATLNALTLNETTIRYVGLDSGLHAGRSMMGAHALKFAFTYIYRPGVADVREQILERLLLVCNVAGVLTIRRNEIAFDELQLPAVGIVDGDEEASDADATRGRPSARPYIVTMLPQVYVRASE